ncbi:MAG: hypothetical protein FD161_4435 [Limisphaerales bacterium]|nr:MAG: hypothetical protein FD161_4435 [Limisphaerales bacterium]KAG0506907.1 MAG: hypothetical protein E1N63_3943 [Limisphaerales bacterium]TXT51815.1 MAG: hypothetical protein FD140_1203 [Limisphaerales bacterium]
MSDTVRIPRSVPPSAKDTVRLPRPAKPATGDTVRLHRAPSKANPAEGASLEDYLKQQKPHVEPPPQ